MTVQFQGILDFWFESTDASASKRWFAHDDAFDARIRQQFGATVIAARAGQLDVWADTPPGWLALLIVLDQFPRNLYRQSAQAFASDAQAQKCVLQGLQRGDDAALPPVQRVFAYMPLEHAEDVALQQRNVDLFTTLRDSVDSAQRQRFAGFLDFALRHQAVIERFGRFPHRNAALGRVSTDAERVYLAQPDSGF